MDRFHVKPPLANRGVGSTIGEGLTSCVDWFSATFLNEQDPSAVIALIGLNYNDFVNAPKGRYGYKKMLILHHINVLYDGRDDMGVHLEITGQGCRVYEKNSDLSWQELFALTRDQYAVISVKRLDLAIDDHLGYFKLTQVINNVKRGYTTSVFRSIKRISNLKVADGTEYGHTIYFGSPQSNIRFRLYDKLSEQIAKKRNVEGIDFWNRIEVELKDERAQSVANILSEDTLTAGEIVAGLLLRYVKFKRPTKGDKNKYRWDLQPWYKKFLADAKPLKLVNKLPEQSIERKYQWISKSVVKTMAMLAITFIDDSDTMLDDFVKEGQDKLTDFDWQLIDDFKKSGLTYTDFLNNLDKKSYLAQ